MVKSFIARGTNKYWQEKTLEKILIPHLKELEQDHLIIRKSLPVVPPYVEYWLSESGKEMQPILNAMAAYGLKYVEYKQMPLDYL